MRLVHFLGLPLMLALSLCAMAASGQPVAEVVDVPDGTPALVTPDTQLTAPGLSETVRHTLDITAAILRVHDACHVLRTFSGGSADAARCRARARDLDAREPSRRLALTRNGIFSTSSATSPPAV